QKVKLVNGLALDLPSHDGRLAAKTRLAGCGTSACILPSLLATLRPPPPSYWATLSLFLGRFDVRPRRFDSPPVPRLRPNAVTDAGCRNQARITIDHKNGPGTSVHSGVI